MVVVVVNVVIIVVVIVIVVTAVIVIAVAAAVVVAAVVVVVINVENENICQDPETILFKNDKNYGFDYFAFLCYSLLLSSYEHNSRSVGKNNLKISYLT